MKKRMLEILLLIAIVVGMNYVYRLLFWEKDLNKYSPEVELIRDVIEKEPQILYLGESSNISYHDTDEDKRKISDFIADYFPGKKMTDLTKRAGHAGIYYTYLKNLPKNSDLDIVIVTLNLRSFDAEWIYSELETSLQQSLVMLRKNPPLVNRFLLSFKAYDIKTKTERSKQIKRYFNHHHLHFPYDFPYNTVAEWDTEQYKKGVYDENGERNETLSILACSYVKTYGFHINEGENPRLKQFDEIVQLARRRGWKLVFNLLPENTERARELVGEDLVYLMRQNRDFLVNYYTQMGVLVIDNLEILPNDQFIDQDWTTEHYYEKGRKMVAERVAEGMMNAQY
ncbi:hypothetical protein LJC68_08210 [Bacteroidales bacterium OttesenSCG-928-B11]|nr:hypothetical protein [Bacteroidales bacterium OttesenSCG-928-E04]MDL2312844.1 hypothetical protein [Bacteroidales bacterium OttesenSCG-928-B11]